MDREYRSWVIALSMLLSSSAIMSAQDAAARTGAYRQPAEAFAAQHRLRIDTLLPAAGSETAPGSRDPRTFFFGGVLQYEATVTNANPLNNNPRPFGADVTLPVAGGRAEVFGGNGAVFVPFGSPYAIRNSWLMQTKTGLRVAIDADRRFWLGTTGYLLTNFGRKTKQRGYGAADLTIRLGH